VQAAVHTRYGSPDVVSVAEVPRPSVGDKDVLVRVRATTVNRTDCAYRAASPFFVRTATGLRRPRRTVLGTEFAGVVVDTGPGVTAFAVGERVFGYNEGAFGTHAEYLAIPEDAPIAAIPDGVSDEHGAAATEGAHYALAMIRVARVRAGQRVFVHGATGGIGSAAVQLLAGLGVTVTATSDTAHVDVVHELGAERVVDHTAGEFTAGAGDAGAYDAVFDAVGKSSFGRCRRLLAPRGSYVCADPGPGWQNLPLSAVTPLLRGRTVRFPFPRQDQAMIRGLAERLASGAFRPLVDRHYPLDEIVAAYRYVESGRKVGNVVIDVWDGEGT
jgi:NADPH:quinone reductase-like Zn-dependent oxidoreductase